MLAFQQPTRSLDITILHRKILQKKKLGENKAFQASDHTLNFPAIDFSLK